MISPRLLADLGEYHADLTYHDVPVKTIVGLIRTLPGISWRTDRVGKTCWVVGETEQFAVTFFVEPGVVKDIDGAIALRDRLGYDEKEAAK